MPKQPQSLLSTLISRLRKRQPELHKAAQPPRPFQAISIYRGMNACTMAKKFSEYRFLAREAPQLPLSGCTQREQCECRYLKHNDRRSAPRRLIDFGGGSYVYRGPERRYRNGRRLTD